ncbi:MAG: hypothetical protein LBU27_06145 [Candidatus Peribacteria bacterium]|jgi:hypothetical protein|nr:hypothetical protein [Candidatus Peribacteria bacterium]
MAQNSKYGYSTIGVQTTPETPVQTNTPISKIDGDILKTTEMVRNTSIQNRYNNASTIVNGNTTIEGDQNTELSPQDAVFALYGVLGKIQSQDVSSAGDGSVLKHTITKGGCELPSFSIEEKIGGCIGGNSDPSGQNTFVRRSFGCLYNSIALAIQEGILTLQNNIIAYGQFDVAFLRADESAEGSSVNITGGSFSDGTLTINATAHGLAVNDIIRITGTPAGIFRVASIINTNSFTIKIATNP